ncbi:MAG: threonylcarbamoyl-AMP synthase [Phycisphaerales bacterium]|nr:threonylcarbamoyl-AMP synthase [Phycisphaerales bacterium]
MSAEFISLKPDAPNTSAIEHATKALAEGALVAFPTETVYGLAANAANSDSMDRLREVKGRGSNQPFTVHIGHASDCENFVPEITTLGRRFMKKAWPGPLTLIFRVDDPSSAKAHGLLSKTSAASIYTQNTVGVRFPDHPVATAILAGTNTPVVASSANVTGSPAPVEAAPIQDELGDKVDLILDDGPTRYRKNSTIVELNGNGYRLIRDGVWDQRTIHRFSTVNIVFVCSGNTCRSPMAEGIFKKMLAEKLGCEVETLAEWGIIVQSAGTMGMSGGRASREAVEVCRRRDVDLTDHASRGLTPELIHSADYIFAMAGHHLDAIRSMAPAHAGKAMLLEPNSRDIADPIGGTTDDYENTAQRITQALEGRLNEVVI